MKRSIFLLLLFFTPFILSAQINLKASKSSYQVSGNANAYGVYPVKLDWTASASAKYFGIYRSTNADKDFILIKEIPSNSKKELSYTDINPSAKPEIKYYYKVVSYNVAGKADTPIEISSIEQGWGALTHEAYFLVYDKTVKKSHSRLVLMNKKGNLNKLGKEQINGLKSGTLSYKTTIKISGFSGVVDMDYVNYSDIGLLVFDGNMDTVANVHGIGTMSGQVKVTGMYPGSVWYDNVQIKNSTAGDGTYGVQPEGLSRKELDYTWTFKDSL